MMDFKIMHYILNILTIFPPHFINVLGLFDNNQTRINADFKCYTNVLCLLGP